MPIQDPANGQIVVRPFAASDSVDLIVDGEPVVTGLGLGTGMSSEVSAGEHEVSVSPPGNPDAAIGPMTLPFTPGMVITLYTLGSPGDGTLTLLADNGDTITMGGGATIEPSATASANEPASPSASPTAASAATSADSDGFTARWWATGAAVLIAIVIAAAMIASRRGRAGR